MSGRASMLVMVLALLVVGCRDGAAERAASAPPGAPQEHEEPRGP